MNPILIFAYAALEHLGFVMLWLGLITGHSFEPWSVCVSSDILCKSVRKHIKKVHLLPDSALVFLRVPPGKSPYRSPPLSSSVKQCREAMSVLQ